MIETFLLRCTGKWAQTRYHLSLSNGVPVGQSQVILLATQAVATITGLYIGIINLVLGVDNLLMLTGS